jgi:antibiotic biosynthesis monooxygenase (ABM) superfamily enzyme
VFAPRPPPKEKLVLLRHIVLVKSDNRQEIDDVLATIPKLVGVVPGLVQVEVGQDVSGRSKGYDRLFVLDFENERALAGWTDHEAHQPIRQTLTRLAEMIVFDYQV